MEPEPPCTRFPRRAGGCNRGAARPRPVAVERCMPPAWAMERAAPPGPPRRACAEYGPVAGHAAQGRDPAPKRRAPPAGVAGVLRMYFRRGREPRHVRTAPAYLGALRASRARAHDPRPPACLRSARSCADTGLVAQEKGKTADHADRVAERASIFKGRILRPHMGGMQGARRRRRACSAVPAGSRAGSNRPAGGSSPLGMSLWRGAEGPRQGERPVRSAARRRLGCGGRRARMPRSNE